MLNRRVRATWLEVSCEALFESSGAAMDNSLMDDIKVVLGKGGRINIPAEYRRALGLVDGDEVLVGMEEGAIWIQTRNASLERARRLVRPYVGGGRPSMLEELSRERRAEAERE